MEDNALAVADRQATNELEQTETALEIAKDVAKTPEEATERDKLLEEIRDLKKRLDETVGERDKFKRERDEANANIRGLASNDKENKTSQFDELLGGMRK